MRPVFMLQPLQPWSVFAKPFVATRRSASARRLFLQRQPVLFGLRQCRLTFSQQISTAPRFFRFAQKNTVLRQEGSEFCDFAFQTGDPGGKLFQPLALGEGQRVL
jgi:hypothetical protein